jgi:hypothetical protein
MKQIYPRKAESCELVKARPETIRLLTDYSRSLNIVRHKGIVFENNLN